MHAFRKCLRMSAALGLVAAALVALAPAAEGVKYVLKYAHNNPARVNTLYHSIALTFQNFLRIYSDGEADVQIFPASQLGKDPVAAKKVQLGSIQMQMVAGNNVASFDRGLDALNLPFLFGSFQGAAKVFRSDVGRRIAENFRKKTGIRILGYLTAGFRNMMNSKHPILKPADLGDLRMRIARNPIMMATYGALGGSAIGIASSELYSSLAQRVVDGHDGATGWSWSNKLHEVQKYVSITRHQLIASLLIINDKYYQGLPPKVREAVDRAAADALEWGNRYAEALEEFALEDWARKGLRIDKPDLRPFREAMRPVYQKFADQVGGMDLINRILAMQK